MDTKKVPKSGYSNYVVSSSSESEAEEAPVEPNHNDTNFAKNKDETLKKSSPDKAKGEPQSIEKIDHNFSSGQENETKCKRVDEKDRSRSRPRDRGEQHSKLSKNNQYDDKDQQGRSRDHRRDYDDRRRRDWFNKDDRRNNNRDEKHRYNDRGDSYRKERYNRDEGDRYQHNKGCFQQQTRKEPKKKDFQETSNKLKEQVEKRKMLWKHGNEEKKVADHWGAMLSTCSDEKQAEKLKKLIGLKQTETAAVSADPIDHQSTSSDPKTSTNASLSELARQKQDELFQKLNQQYEMGRMSTHTHRGLGLGFSSQMNEYASQIQNMSHNQQQQQPQE